MSTDEKVLVKELEAQVEGLEQRVTELEAAESELKGLRDREAQVRAILDAADNVSFIVTDLGGKDCKVLEYSAGAEKLFGWTREEMLGELVARLHLPEDVERFDEVQTAMADRREGFAGQSTLVRKSGEHFPALFTTYPIFDTQGEMKAALGVSFDISERLASEERLAESETFLQSVFDAIQDGISVIDRELKVIRVNERMEQMYQHATPIEGKTCHEVYQGRQEVCSYCPTVRAFESGEQESALVPYATPEGRKGWIDLSAFPLKGERGEVTRVIEYVKDITDRYRAEQQLQLQLEIATALGSTRDLDEALEFLVAKLSEVDGIDGIAIYLVSDVSDSLELVAHQGLSEDFVKRASQLTQDSPARVIVEAGNPAYGKFEDNTDLTIGDFDGLRAFAVLPLRYRDHHVGSLNVASRELDEFKKGTRFLLESIAAQVSGVVARIHSERDRLALESKILQAQKLESLGVLAGGIAHDFNNLLVGILGNADLALMDLTPESPARQSVHDIEAAARRATELARQMLAYSGKGRFVVEPLDLGVLIEEMLHLLEASITKKAVLRLDLARSLPLVEADASQIRQVVMNLVTNASDAVDDRSGVISVRTGAMECDRLYLEGAFMPANIDVGPYVFIEVSDTGVGMDSKTTERVFDPFFSTKFTGRGLGLAAVLGIVRAHSGAIKVYSELGKGTTFKALFPAISTGEEEASQPDYPSLIPSEEDRRGTILLVDDEETVRVVGRSMLERLGFEVVTAFDGREGLTLYAKEPDRFFCVILDLTMPHMDGEECFRELRLLRPEVQVFLSSGYNEQDLVGRFAGKRLAGFIQKPYRLKDLAAVLEQIESK